MPKKKTHISLTQNFLMACGVGLTLAAGNVPALAGEVAAQPAATVTTADAPDLFCEVPHDMTLDANQGVWIGVQTTTKDGVPISFDLSLTYALSGVDGLRVDCLGVGRHVLGFGKIAFEQEIMAMNYQDLPDHRGQFVLNAVTRLNDVLRSMLSSNEIEITHAKIKNTSAPGLSSEQATFMLFNGLPETKPDSQHPKRVTHENSDGASVTVVFEPEYEMSQQAYRIFGPDNGQADNFVHGALRAVFARHVQGWDERCIESDRNVLRDTVYLDARKLFKESGVNLTGLEIRSITASVPQTVIRNAEGGELSCFSPQNRME